MALSVPGNSCRSVSCRPLVTSGCTIRVSGKCIYYAGVPLSDPSINTGEDYDSILVKLIAAIGSGGGSGNVTSVGLTMPPAFDVGNSPITSAGTLTVVGLGTSSQYITGEGTLGTASNGLTPGAGTLKLGGPLTETTFLTGTTDTERLEIVGTANDFTPMLRVTNNSNSLDAVAFYATIPNDGTAIYSFAGAGTGVFGQGDIGIQGAGNLYGMYASTAGTGISFSGNSSNLAFEGTVQGASSRAFEFSKAHNVTNNISSLGKFIRRPPTSVPTAGFGVSLDFELANTSSSNALSNQLISRWTGLTSSNGTSEFSITGVNTAVANTLFVLGGNGRVTFPFYGDGSFTAGTRTYLLAVDSSGNLMEVLNTGDSFYTVDGTITNNRTVAVGGFPLVFSNVGLFRVTEGNATVGGTYDFNDGVDFLVYNATNSSNLVMNPLTGLTFEYTALAGPTLESSFTVDGTGVKVTGLQEFTDNAAALAGGLTAGYLYRDGDTLKIVH